MRTVTVRPIRIIHKRNTVEEQQKIIPLRRSKFLEPTTSLITGVARPGLPKTPSLGGTSDVFLRSRRSDSAMIVEFEPGWIDHSV
jgi:hypothetical protein